MQCEEAALQSTRGEPVALVGVNAKGKVTGLLFELTVEQRYRNTTASNIEAVYTFPLPHDATLLDLEVEFGGKALKGVVVEKRAAEASYEEAIDAGNTAIMVERAANGMLTANLGNLLPGEEACLRYSYAQLLRFERDLVRLTVPTVIAPRYGDRVAAGLQLHQVPVTDLAVAYPVTLSIELHDALAGGRISSPSHAITTRHAGDAVVVTFDASAALDRDFVLTVDGLAGRSTAVVQQAGDEYVALASFYVDEGGAVADAPLRLKLLLDCSGSMAGDSIEAARRALHRILAALTPEDVFSFSRFGNALCHDTAGLVPAKGPGIRHVAQRVGTLQADLGGTEMESALLGVFDLDNEGAGDVLLITDGEIWAADSLVAAARTAGQRVFVVGVGSAPAEDVLRRLAEATGGACEFVASSEDSEAAIVRMFQRMRAPRIAHASVAWPATPSWETTLPSGIFVGETVHVFAGFARPPEGRADLRVAESANEERTGSFVSLPAIATTTKSLSRIAAAERIRTVDSESRLALALRHSLLTDQTNLLIVHQRVDAEKAPGLPSLSVVPQMLAAGWGGVGGVRFSLSCYEDDVSYSYAFDAPMPVIRRARYPTDASASVASDWIATFLSALDAAFGAHAALPATFGDLERLGLPAVVLDELRALTVSAHDEMAIVEAFVLELKAFARRSDARRQLRRVPRRRTSTTGAPPDVRQAVIAVVARFSRPSTIAVPKFQSAGAE
jgi:Ca-activated chloride channel homolog